VTVEMGRPWYNPLGSSKCDSGNQTYFTIENTFSNLNFYEFVSDQYDGANGIIILRTYFLPNSIYAKKLNWREIIGVRGVYGTISDANRGTMGCSIWLLKMYIGEYSAG
jgi:hypothetical protein